MEVLLAVSIISVALFSILFYFIANVNAMRTAYFRSIADIQLANFAEIIRENVRESSQFIAYNQWCFNNRLLFPHAESFWKKRNNNECELTIQWMYQKLESETLHVLC